MGVQQFASRIKEINQLIPYMLGKRKPLNEDKELIEILWFALPLWYHAMAVQAQLDYALDYASETFQSALAYFTRLQIIESMVDTAKGLNKGKKPNINPNKPKNMKKPETMKIMVTSTIKKGMQKMCARRKRNH